MFQKPKAAKRLYFDVIPRAVDDYRAFLERAAGEEEDKRLENPAWHIHAGAPPEPEEGISFSLLLNLAELADRLAALPPGADGETVQAEVYAVGRAHGFEPLRTWFAALYEVLLGRKQGPRFGSFAALYGLAETEAMIRSALARNAA